MKRIIQKGIAGLGNRFQVLGMCADLALEHNAEQVLIDWHDSSFDDDFSHYFAITGNLLKDFIPGQFPGIEPEWWKDRVNVSCIKKLAGEDFARIKPEIVNSDWLTLVVCQYRAEYSNAIFENLMFKPAFMARIAADPELAKADKYICYHIRATDKSSDDPAEDLKAVFKDKTKLKKVLITDNLDIKNEAKRRGVYCPSLIPPVPAKGGVHHSSAEALARSGLTRRQLNESTVYDLLLGVSAEKFQGTCEISSYSQLIERWREFLTTKNTKEHERGGK